MNAIQVFQRQDLSVSATPEVRLQIEQALESTALIGAVSDVESNARAADAIGQLKAIAATIEKARKAIKEPMLELGRAIDAKAKELSQELVVEMNRIGKAVTDWQTEQMERVREANRLQDAGEPAFAPATAKGQSVREEYEFEMTNPFDLVRTHPGLVEITLRRAEAKAAIEALARTGVEPKIPGLCISKAVKVQQRATKNAVIEV